jgi:hypothetical protein
MMTLDETAWLETAGSWCKIFAKIIDCDRGGRLGARKVLAFGDVPHHLREALTNI